MTSLCLISLARVASWSERYTINSLVNGNHCRLLCSKTRWMIYPSEQRYRYDCSSNRNVLHILSKSSYQLRDFNRISSQYAEKTRIEQGHNIKVDSQNPQLQTDPSKSQIESEADDLEQFQKLSLYGKIKAMYRDYWYVLVPVHIASSAIFFSAFYYAASSGMDIAAILETLHVGEKVISTFKDSSIGYIGVAYALYKIATPVRYTITLGGTTWAIRFLKTRGLIKPRRPMKAAKENVQSIISAMKLPEEERQKFLENKGLGRIGKAVGQASSAMSNISNKSSKEK